MPISQSLHHQPHGLLQQVQRQWNTWLLLVVAEVVSELVAQVVQVDLELVQEFLSLQEILTVLLLVLVVLAQLLQVAEEAAEVILYSQP
jgi:phage-related holin